MLRVRSEARIVAEQCCSAVLSGAKDIFASVTVSESLKLSQLLVRLDMVWIVPKVGVTGLSEPTDEAYDWSSRRKLVLARLRTR